jgi:signal transduction histidine kinase
VNRRAVIDVPTVTKAWRLRRAMIGVNVGSAIAVMLLAIPDTLFVPHPSALDHAITVSTLPVFCLAGLVASIRRPDSWIGPLMILYAFAGYARDFGSSSHLTLFMLGAWATTMPIAVVAHLVLTYPTGRGSSFVERAVILALYGNCLLEGLVDTGYEGLYRISVPRGILIVSAWTVAALLVRQLLNSNSARQISMLSVLASSAFVTGLIVAYDVLDFVRLGNLAESRVHRALTISRSALALIALGLVVYRFAKASRPTRRSLVPTWISAAVLALITVGSWSVFGHPSEVQIGHITRWTSISAGLIPLAYLWGLLRMHLVRGTVGRLLIQLGGAPAGGVLRDALARTLRDPSLELAFWLPGSRTYVDSLGRPVALPPQGSGRAVTVLERQGEPLAALVHDPALANERDVVEAAAAAAGLALENERLHAEVRAQLDEVRASRARIVAAGDQARRKVERDLHDGAQQRLVTVSLALRVAQEQLGAAPEPVVAATLAEADAELKLALGELRELARGIHPAILTEEGLGPALQSLAERSTLRARILASPAGRLPPPVEATAYFVVAEALSNAAKYSGASVVTIDVVQADGRLIVNVADDGVGGAIPTTGSGLRGLADRVATLDGRLEVDSPSEGGTRVIAEIPCG